MKKVCILAPAYPYRGGLASFTQMLAGALQEKEIEVDILTFTLQYPSILFPGKTQYSESAPPENLNIKRVLSSVNPFSWQKVGKLIQRTNYDALITKYWTPFLAPCLGWVSAMAQSKNIVTISAVDNIVPHERHFYDPPLNRYYINRIDGFIYMSEQVHQELLEFKKEPLTRYAPHPVYSNYGQPLHKADACKELGLDADFNYLLFFGLIRDYKGLDLLLEAFAMLKKEGKTAKTKLLIAGEFYANREKYMQLIKDLGLKEQDDFILDDHFVPDKKVKLYFSASDAVVQPYKTATQSGVTQIAFQMHTPMLVTRVGGLPEIVKDGYTGYVTEVEPVEIAKAIEKLYEGDNISILKKNVAEDKHRFSWEYFTEQLESLYYEIREKKKDIGRI